MARRILVLSALIGTLAWAPGAAHAHCDAVDGPVATAAREALATGNVALVLPYVPAEAEAELTSAFERAAAVRGQSADAKALSDLYFSETAVRLHRAGEGAPYTGLQPEGTDFGPAIPAAEEALESGRVEPLVAMLSETVERAVTERFRHLAESDPSTEATGRPLTAAEVPAARQRVSEELAFIGYVEGIYLATQGGVHAEGAAAAEDCGH